MTDKFKVYLTATRKAINNQQPTTNNQQPTTNNQQQNPPTAKIGGLINQCLLQSASAKFDKILFNRDVIAFKKVLS